MSLEHIEMSRQVAPAASVEAVGTSAAPQRRQRLKNKEQITLQLDVDVVSMFRATGRGWEGRMNAALREWLGPPWAV